ncbi:MAG: lasso peptide biosynthesis B2 protein [Halobacteriota archaeon]
MTQALAGKVLFTLCGYPAVVHVGVIKEEGSGTFQAHVWLESHGKVVIDESEVAYGRSLRGVVKSRSNLA